MSNLLKTYLTCFVKLNLENDMVTIKNLCKLWCDFSTLQQYYSVLNTMRWRNQILSDVEMYVFGQ